MVWVAVVAILLLTYIASYPVASDYNRGVPANIQDLPEYAPVEWLIDYTPAKAPIMWWAEVLGMEDRVEFRWECREHERDILDNPEKYY